MTKLIRPAEIKDYFLKINRLMTLSLIFLLIAASLVFWLTKAVTLENSSFWIGAAFMLLAIIFYQLPYLSYLLTRAHFNQHGESDSELLNSGWSQFKNSLDL